MYFGLIIINFQKYKETLVIEKYSSSLSIFNSGNRPSIDFLEPLINNLENLSAGKINQKIMLESIFDEYIILVVDSEDKQMIQGSDVKIFDDLNQPVKLQLNDKTGEFKVVLEKNKKTYSC